MSDERRGPPARACHEHVSVPSGQSFLWRIDDYPCRRSVWNHHPEFEIHLIRHSSGTAHVGDHIGRFDAGHLMLIGRDLPHDWRTPLVAGQTLPGRDIVVQFDPDRLDRAAAEFPELVGADALFARASLGIEWFGRTAVEGARLLESMGEVGSLARLGLLLELLSLMVESSEFRTLATPSFVNDFQPVTTAGMELIGAVLEHVQRHHTDDLKQSDVASMAGMSSSGFSRFFKSSLGHTFTEHLERMRILTARKLLAETVLPITTVCFESGYGNVSMFNRAFRRRTRMTPSEYRKAAFAGRRIGRPGSLL